MSLIKVAADEKQGGELMNVVDIFRAKIVDVAHKALTIELTGNESKIGKFIDLMDPFGIREGEVSVPLPEQADASLYFIGLFQPLGCIWPLADHQAKLACAEIQGRYQRPRDMPAAIAHELAHPHYRWEAAPRHSTEVDYHMFRRELLAELAKASGPRAATHTRSQS